MTNFYNQYGGNYNPGSYDPRPNPQQQKSNDALLAEIGEFAKTVQNPEQQVQQLLQSGRMTQEQYQLYAQIANMLTNHR